MSQRFSSATLLIAACLALVTPTPLVAQTSVTLHWVEFRFVDVVRNVIEPTSEVMRVTSDQINAWDAFSGQDFEITGVSYSYRIPKDVIADAGLEQNFPNQMFSTVVTPFDGSIGLTGSATVSGALGFLPTLNRVPRPDGVQRGDPPQPAEPLEFRLTLRQINTGEAGSNPIIAQSDVIQVFFGEALGLTLINPDPDPMEPLLIGGKQTFSADVEIDLFEPLPGGQLQLLLVDTATDEVLARSPLTPLVGQTGMQMLTLPDVTLLEEGEFALEVAVRRGSDLPGQDKFLHLYNWAGLRSVVDRGHSSNPGQSQHCPAGSQQEDLRAGLCQAQPSSG